MGELKNTKISYLYRNDSDRRKANSVIVKGKPIGCDGEEETAMIKNALYDETFFIPEQIGLPLERPDNNITEDDHCWAEIDPYEDIALVEDDPTIDLTWDEVVSEFEKALDHGWNEAKYAVYV